MPRVTVVVPTYDEAENVRILIPQILAQPLDATVLVVDDSSPDGTGKIVEAMAQDEDRIQVLHRPRKEGLGAAYREGLQAAIERGADVVVQMDADRSHDPDDLPRLVKALDDASLALGSRYRGGVRVIDWPISRLLFSIGANLYVRAVTGLRISDCTGGYRAWRAGALAPIAAAATRTTGYAFLVEMLYLAVASGLRVVEVPIVFTERRLGRSSLSGAAILESLAAPLRLRLGVKAERKPTDT